MSDERDSVETVVEIDEQGRLCLSNDVQEALEIDGQRALASIEVSVRKRKNGCGDS